MGAPFAKLKNIEGPSAAALREKDRQVDNRDNSSNSSQRSSRQLSKSVNGDDEKDSKERDNNRDIATSSSSASAASVTSTNTTSNSIATNLVNMLRRSSMSLGADSSFFRGQNNSPSPENGVILPSSVLVNNPNRDRERDDYDGGASESGFTTRGENDFTVELEKEELRCVIGM